MRASVLIAALAATPFATARSFGARWDTHDGRHGRHGHHGHHGHGDTSTDVVESSTASEDYEDTTATEAPDVDDVTDAADATETTDADEDTVVTVEQSVVPVAADTTTASTAAAETSASTGSGSVSALNMGTYSGIATYYTGDLAGGTCSFSTYSLPEGMHGVALSSDGWDPMHCGACIEITGPKGNKITAMVVDQCPTCAADHIDLFPDAFATLDDPVIGVIQTSYEFVSCGISSPMKLHNKDSTSQYWFAMQVVNHNVPVQSLEVSVDGGSTWQGTDRTYYNFFEKASGFGTSSVDVKVKSTTGEEMIVKGVSVDSNTEDPCPGNF